jgi:hypothetical protein
MSNRFSSAAKITQTVWDMRNADLPRSSNRARIDELFNGNPPYSDAEKARNRINTNVNFLEPTHLFHKSNRQFLNAILKPGNFFTVRLDSGPIHKRVEWGEIITQEINKQMKRGPAALHYRETLRNVFAQVVIHGIGPAEWSDKYSWVPNMHMLSDIQIPSRTLLTMENLSYFSVFRRYTAEQIWKMTHGPRVDKAWQMPVVDQCLKWAAKQYGQTRTNNDTQYNPERWQEDIKSDSGWYGSDQVPTIDCQDFYYLADDNKDHGWRRKIVLSCPEGVADGKNFLGENGTFIYDAGERKYADTLDQIIHFQFADGSVVAPFRYHSVRSLGFLLYSVCHLQNRLRCKFNDHIFESLLQYFRVSNPQDAERLQKVDLINHGIIPDGLQFVPMQERWQINGDLIGAAMQLNRQSMQDASENSTQDFEFAKDQQEKTATQYLGEANATAAMVGTMLQEAYGYQEFQYYEIGRRFCIKNSRDASARAFRNECLSRGVPEEFLSVNRWNISAERVIGSGNKQLEIAQTGMLMQQYNRYSPEAQKKVLRAFTFAVVDDAAQASDLAPIDMQGVNSAQSFGQVSMGALMQGLPVQVPPGINRIDVVETWLASLASIVGNVEQSGGVPTQQQLTGELNTVQAITEQVDIIAQDPEEKTRVKQYSDDLAKLENLIRAHEQRFQEQQQQQQPQGGDDGAAQAKVVSAAMTTQAQIKMKEEAHQQKLEHKQQSFEQKSQQQAVSAAQQHADAIQRTLTDTAAKDLTTQAEIQREASRPVEPKPAKSP